MRPIGPGTSIQSISGMMWSRLISPRLTLSPTTALATAGMMIDPCVSLPTATAARFAATATPDPLLDPEGSNGPHGQRVCPPSTLNPFGIDGSI